MKFIGHTMAIPGIDIAEGIKLFKKLGLDGIEIAAQAGTPFHIDLPDNEIKRIIKASYESELPVVTLTPYFWDINHADDKIMQENVDGLIKAIQLAKKMGAKFVRAYSGKEAAGGTQEQNFERSVAALKKAGGAADSEGIMIVVENHPGTMTRTGIATVEMIEAVGMSCVQALFDPCNVMYDTDEDWLTTYEAQKDIIGYVHCKDYRMNGKTRSACVVGEGIVPWLELLRRLKDKNYNISFEYEKRWYPDQIEDAVTGLPKCKEYVLEGLK